MPSSGQRLFCSRLLRHGGLGTRYSLTVSYIEIAQAYLRHDWANAVDAYWSPLYSWLIAAAFLVLHPNPYWEVATAHLVLALTFFVGLFFFEYFLRELNLFLKDDRGGGASPISMGVLYIAGYSAFLFGGLALVGVGYCSPDMIAYALMFFLSGATLRASRTGGSDLLFIAIGAACALFYLARTAFAPSILVFLLIVLGLRWKQGLGLIRPTALIVLPCMALSAPFIFAISHKAGTLTIGESGRLNYGWEVDGASRLIHWQGEPFDIGTPSHPTQKAVAAPETFVFPGPIAGMYPPWYDPSYWYAGIRPKFKLGQAPHPVRERNCCSKLLCKIADRSSGVSSHPGDGTHSMGFPLRSALARLGACPLRCGLVLPRVLRKALYCRKFCDRLDNAAGQHSNYKNEIQILSGGAPSGFCAGVYILLFCKETGVSD